MNKGVVYMKVVKIILLITFLAGLAVFLFKELRPKTFRFTDFRTDEELKVYLLNKFPVGSNANKLVEFLKDAGAECKVVTSSPGLVKELQGYKFVVTCKYSPGWFSLHPLHVYRLAIMANGNKNIINVLVVSVKGMANLII